MTKGSELLTFSKGRKLKWNFFTKTKTRHDQKNYKDKDKYNDKYKDKDKDNDICIHLENTLKEQSWIVVAFETLITFLTIENNNINNYIVTSGWREAEKSNRKEKEKFENNFSHFERRKRNLNSLSPVSRWEREIIQNILNFREENYLPFPTMLQ